MHRFRSRPASVAPRLLVWLRVVLLSLLVATPGLVRASMVDCPTMAMPAVTAEAEPPCHEMVAPVKQTPPDAGSTECCGAACTPALGVLPARVTPRALPVAAVPDPMPALSLVSIARLPEKPPPRA